MNRAALQAEVVETAALRRSDELKTAVLRSVSHDLRTPLTAILTAITALDAKRPTSENVADVREQVIDAATRLWQLIEKLLDLSVLQSGRAEPRLVWYSIDEVLEEAIEQVRDDFVVFKLSAERGMPLLRGDPGQLERAFVNVLENARRHSGGHPVSVRARAVRRLARAPQQEVEADGRAGPPSEAPAQGDRLIVLAMPAAPKDATWLLHNDGTVWQALLRLPAVAQASERRLTRWIAG